MYCWGLATSVGMEAQVKALTEAIAVDIRMKELEVRPPFVWLPNMLMASGLNRWMIPLMLRPGSDKLSSPWPEMVISCGRRSAMMALGLQPYLRAQTRSLRRAGDSDNGNFRTRFVHIQDPQVNPAHFDLVIAMDHDKVSGSNVLHTRYALHRITPQKLNEAAQHQAERFAAYPRPLVSVLLGGSTNKYTLTSAAMQEIIAKLRAMLASMPGSLFITPSRRTGEENIRLLQEVFYGNPNVYIYDGSGSNPYLAMLALADSIVVSNDSVNMMSEAAATGKPLYPLLLPGHSGTKPARFCEKLLAEGTMRLWSGNWQRWDYDIKGEMRQLAEMVKQRLQIP
ncbi:MAG: mitochondrial fission ELM1 family protein [Alphaproteobacteria bacterium]